MNKKYLVLFIGVVVFFGLFIVFIISQQNQNQGLPKPSSLQEQNPVALKKPPVVTLAPLSGSAQQAAKQFYEYYFSTPENPLAAGKYMNNPYLTQDFKYNLKTGYNNGNAPIFCPQNKRENITAGKNVQVYLNNQYMTQVTISEASPSAKDLYTILLAENNGNWQVEDVNCLY